VQSSTLLWSCVPQDDWNDNSEPPQGAVAAAGSYRTDVAENVWEVDRPCRIPVRITSSFRGMLHYYYPFQASDTMISSDPSCACPCLRIRGVHISLKVEELMAAIACGLDAKLVAPLA
jgi:hypothetical protein